MNCLITYSDSKYQKRADEIKKQSKSVFTFHFDYTREWLEKTDFYQKNKHILDQERGGGYWLWKPFVILETIQKFKFFQGPVNFLYMDCGDSFDSSMVIQKMEEALGESTICLTRGRHPNHKYTKGSVFDFFATFDENYNSEELKNATQVEAGLILFKNNAEAISLFQEWLFYCKKPFLLTDLEYMPELNSPEFIDHRHDQSILSILAARYNIKTSDVIRDAITCNTND